MVFTKGHRDERKTGVVQKASKICCKNVAKNDLSKDVKKTIKAFISLGALFCFRFGFHLGKVLGLEGFGASRPFSNVFLVFFLKAYEAMANMTSRKQGKKRSHELCWARFWLDFDCLGGFWRSNFAFWSFVCTHLSLLFSLGPLESILVSSWSLFLESLPSAFWSHIGATSWSASLSSA